VQKSLFLFFRQVFNLSLLITDFCLNVSPEIGWGGTADN
jgi:hypothetical protein